MFKSISCKLLRRGARLYTCHVINFVPPCPSLESISPLTEDSCSHVVTLRPLEGLSAGNLNARLEDFCKAQPSGQCYGFGILDPDNMEESISFLNNHPNWQHNKGVIINCELIANQIADYKKCYYLFQLCASASIPVALHGGERYDYNNGGNGCIDDVGTTARALARIITDGIFDYYPNLQVIIYHDKAIPLVADALKDNHPGNSLQKQITSYYLQNNVFCVSSCSDFPYLQFLEASIRSDRILFGDELTKERIFPPISDIVLQKIMNRNAKLLLGLNDTDETSRHYQCDESKVSILESPAIKFLSSKVRDKNTNCKDFMKYSDRLMTILAEETLARMRTVVPCDITTPTGVFRGVADRETRQFCAVSIVRSGDILLEAFRRLLPGLRVGKILVQRDETSADKKPVFYYKKLSSDISNCTVLLVDPMLATGGSVLCALDCLVKHHHVNPEDITFVNLFACEEGLSALHERYPQVRVVTLYVDEYLNSEKYIVPGVGDFGDRYYGTVE